MTRPGKGHKRPSTSIRFLAKGARYVLAGLVALFVMINVHEIGHTVLARLLGDARATYALYRLHPDGRLACIGCNVYHEAAPSLTIGHFRWRGHRTAPLSQHRSSPR